MKTAAAIVFLVLGLFCSFQGAAAHEVEAQGFCHEYHKAPSACPEEYHPICGTDGKKYSNKCFLCKAVWENLGSVCFQKEGEC